MNASIGRTALLLVEFQQQWTRPGLFHFLIQRQLHARDVLTQAALATHFARARGIPVIHAPLVIDPAHLRGWYAQLTRGLFFRKGTPQAELDARVYQPGDPVVQGRTAFDAFVGSNLAELLQACACQRLLLGGFATDQCVARTAATARELGLETWLLSDASATFAEVLQQRAERTFGDKVMTVAQWQGQPEFRAVAQFEGPL